MEDNDQQKKIGHYQDGHLTLLVQFPLPVLQGALPVTKICLGNQHIYALGDSANSICLHMREAKYEL